MAIAALLPPLIRQYGCADLCFAGGVTLNCTANARVVRELGIRSHIHPAAGDAGGALGAALQSVMRERADGPAHRYALSPYLGVSYPEGVIKATLSINKIPYRKVDNIAEEIASRLAEHKVVG